MLHLLTLQQRLNGVLARKKQKTPDAIFFSSLLWILGIKSTQEMNSDNAMSKNMASPEASSTSPGCDYLCTTHTETHTREPGRRALLSLVS